MDRLDASPGSGVTDLVSLLRLRASSPSGDRAIAFLRSDGTEIGFSYAELDRRARAIAASITELGLARECALLLYPPGLDYVTGFFGCLYAGAIAVPAYPPDPARLDRTLPRLVAIIEDARAKLILTTRAISTMIGMLGDRGLGPVACLATDDLAPGAETAWRAPNVDARTLAFLQYTSGSTGDPKGVMVSHGNLITNMAAAYRRFGAHTGMVSWLPPYHDMGLIGGIVQPLFGNYPTLLIASLDFLRRPRIWLETISRSRSSLSGAPNFALALCLRKVPPEAREGLDLSSWKVAFCGAEPITAEVLEAFAHAFAPCGFRPESFLACYGLAEATLFVSGKRTRPVSFTVDAQKLEQGRVAEARPGDKRRTLVGCGPVAPAHEIAIVDPERLERCRPGQVGEIWFAGASVAQGYWGKEDQTAATFRAVLPDRPGVDFLRTGDLGFVRDDELFVTGRLKDLIIIRGRNHYPQDIERTAEAAHPAIRAGGSAAFSLEVDGEERLAVVADLDGRTTAVPDAIIAAVRRAIGDAHELAVHHVVLAPPGTVPKTSSGKLQRRTCRELLVTGKLVNVASSELAAGELELPDETVLDGPALRALPADHRRSALEDALRTMVARTLRVAPSSLAGGDPLARFGLDSLSAVELKIEIESRFGVELPPSAVLDDPIAQLAELVLRGLAHERAAALAPINWAGREAERHPLTPGQRGLWFLHLRSPGTSDYNLCAAYAIHGALDVAALRTSLQHLVDRHAALRAVFGSEGGVPYFVVRGHVELDLVEIDTASLDEAGLRARLDDEANRPFDLTSRPAFRAHLFVRSPTEYVLQLVVHHVIADFGAFAVVTDELDAIYRAVAAGRSPALGVAPDLRDHVARSAAVLERDGDVLWRYWNRQLAGAPPVLDLPSFRRRPATLPHPADAHLFRIPAVVTARLREIARAEHTTLYVVLVAAFHTLLHRYSGQDDIWLPSLMSGRTRPGDEQLVGYLTNLVVVRGDLSGDPPFVELVRTTRRTVLDAFAHHELPFASLIERIGGARDASRPPLQQVMFVFNRARDASLEALGAIAVGEDGARIALGGLASETVAVKERFAQFDLTLAMTERAGGLVGSFKYSSALFDGATIRTLAEHFSTLLASIAANPGDRLHALALLSSAERERLTPATRPWPAAESRIALHRRFETRARKAPTAIAVSMGYARVTYRELDERSSQLARHLVAVGVRHGDRVGLMLERSVEQVVGVLAILKAGAAYVPIDTLYPVDRARFMLEDSGARALVSDAVHGAALAGIAAAVVAIDSDALRISELPADPLDLDGAPDDIAYVIYTSALTGRPKGVQVRHHNVARLLDATLPWFQFAASDVWTLFHSIAFDVSVWEMWGALLFGGRLVVVPYLVSRTPEAMLDLVRRERVTILTQTPSAFAPLMHADAAAAPGELALRSIVFCGEALNPASLLPWFDRHGDARPQLVNMYGITETTVHSSYRVITMRDAREARGSMIGVPIPDLALYILDRELRPVPIGVAGEIVVGGDGVAHGYLNRPELTAERFAPDPFRPGATLYRSGDLARLHPDGDMEYLGRIDDQVKIRGFRIELGEIEAVVASHPAIREAVVLAREDDPGDKRLVGYVVARDGAAIDDAMLRDWIRVRLPDYMVPALVSLPRLPLTTNGKIDRRALPRPQGVRSTLGAAYVVPSTEPELALAAVWGEVLRVDQVGLDDSFFDLGGDSIRSLQVVAKARTRGFALTIEQLFRNPTIRELSRVAIRTEDADIPIERFSLISPEDRVRLPDGLEDVYPLSTLLAGLVFHAEHGSGYERYLSTFTVRGRFDRPALERALERIAARHAILRSAFDMFSFSCPMHLVYGRATIPLEVVDLRGLPSHEQAPHVAAWIEREKRRPPDWTRAPLAAMTVHLCSEDRYRLTFAEPFLDGWSVSSLWLELLRTYVAASAGEATAIDSPPAFTYGDFVAAERAALAAPATLRFWSERLAGAVGARQPRWPLLRGGETPHGDFIFEVPADTFEGLKQVARQASLPLKSVLVAAHVRVVGLASGRRDVLTGVFQNGRIEAAGGDQVLGMFLNTLPIRHELSGGTWLELIRAVFDNERDCLPHRRYPFAQLQKEFGGGQPLLDTACNFTQFHPLDRLRGVPGIEVVDYHTTDQTYLFWTATYNVAPDGSKLIVALDGNGPTWEHLTALRGHFLTVLAAIASNPQGRYDGDALLADEQREIAAWNATETPFPGERCFHELFEAQAARTPDAIAAADATAAVTYSELNARANRMARYFVDAGVVPDEIVPIRAEKGLVLLTAMIAVNKAGAAFLPVDPHSPPQRLAQILSQCRARVVVADQAMHAGVVQALERGDEPRPQLVALEELGARDLPAANLPARGAPGNIAYVMFTSGSTGTPKGALVEQRGMINHLYAKNRDLGMGPHDVFAQTGAQGFDLFVFQCFSPLLVGGRTQIVVHDDAVTTERLVRQIRRHGITILEVVPSQLRTLIEEAARDAATEQALRGLRWMIPTGEALPPGLCREWFALFPNVPLLNAYGSTECSDDQAHHPMVVPPIGDTTPVGRPIQNLRIYVLDDELHPVAIGVPGEVYIGGVGVGRGYLGDPVKTAQKFLPDPFSSVPGARMYRQGDLGRWLPGGLLDALGRADFMVKIRGFRIELGEIETAILEYPGVRDAVAMVREDIPGRKQLVSYVVARAGATIEVGALRAALRDHLPEHMVPTGFVMLDELPLNQNGKVDRKALPVPTLDSAGGAPVRTPTEEIVAGIFAQVLKTERVGRSDSFFELGGDSLLATQVVSRVRAALAVPIGVRDVFEAATVAALAERVDVQRRGERAGEPPCVHDPELPAMMSSAQQRLWFLDRLEPDSASYNIANAFRVEGALDVAAFARAWSEIVRRHEVLHTTFPEIDGVGVPVVAAAGRADVAAHDLRHELPDTTRADREAAALARARAEIERPFALATGPLWRVIVFQLAEREHLLVVVLHHIAADGWSLGVLIEEIAALYAAYAQGAASRLPELPVQYVDYARWQHQALRGDRLAAELGYWRNQLAGAPRALDLPTDRPRPPIQSMRGGRIAVTLPGELASAIRALARRDSATPFMVVLAALQIVLAHNAGQDDISVGVPIAGRIRPELEGLIGCFANTLVLRTRVEWQASFRELLARVRETTLAGHAHQAVPFEKLVEVLRPERDLSRSPLFQVMLTWHNAGLPRLEDLTLYPVELHNQTAKFDLTLALTDTGAEEIAGGLEYSDVFAVETANGFVHQLAAVLDAAVRSPERRIAELPLLDDVDRAAAVRAATGARIARPEGLCAHHVFERQAERTPDARALSCDGAALTYRELDRRANQVAHALIALGVGRDRCVALCLERSLDIVVGLLGILKAGAAYVPLDPGYPRDRLAYMLDASGARVLLTHRRSNGVVPAGDHTVLDLDAMAARPSEPVRATVHPDQLAYVIFTSGSTGRPKGVAMTHRPLVNLLLWQAGALAPGPRRTLQLASFSFDMHFTELFSAWIAGGEAVVVPERLRLDGPSLARAIADDGIERMLVSFSFLQELAEAYEAGSYVPSQLREVVSTAEPLRTTPAVRRVFGRLAGATLYNQYGPTETHVVTMATLGDRVDDWPAAPPIGRPIDNAEAHVLDDTLAPVPPGVVGELYLGGDALARGYLGRPDLTAERFVPSPFGAAGSRLYRTGDRARRRRDGAIECLGRVDDQVKIRGLRIEPAEVEAALVRHPGVESAVVVARPDRAGDPQLVAHIIARGGPAPSAAVLRRFLLETLPVSAVPAAFVAVAAFPLTPSGKIDRRALPAPETALAGSAPAPVEPHGRTETWLAGIWRALLGAKSVGATSDFFELGGHSLLATQVMSRIRRLFGVDLPVRAVFEAPTVRELARRIDAALAIAPAAPLPALGRADRTSPLPLSFAQLRLWFLDQLQPGNAAYNLPAAVRIEGALAAAALERALAELVRRHEALRTSFALRGGDPAQVIAPPAFTLDRIDLELPTLEARVAEAERIAVAEAARPFDLASGPLFRATLVRLGARDHVLVLNMHHIVSDGWSRGVLLRELAAIYEAFAADRPSPLADLPIQYADFAAWQRQALAGGALDRQIDYWRHQLQGAPPALELPTDFARPAVQSFRGGSVKLAVPGELAQQLRAFCLREGVTPYMALLAAFQVLLARSSGEQDICVGSPTAGRSRPELEGLIGFFVNTLVLRARVSGQLTFRELVSQVRGTTLTAFANQDVPFERLVEVLRPARSLGRTPLFQAMFALHNAPLPAVSLGELSVRPIAAAAATAKFDLVLSLEEAADGLAGELEYAADLFTTARMARFAERFVELVAEVVAAPERRIAALSAMSQREREELAAWNASASAGVAAHGDDAELRAPAIHQRVAAQARLRPDDPAVACEGRTISYRELDARANQLAHELLARGLGGDRLVALCMERSIELVVALLGILKAGAAYAPLDLEAPQARLDELIGELGRPVVVTVGALAARFAGTASVVCLDRDRAALANRPTSDPAQAVDPGDLAYVLFTSGSTGRAKGVMIPHRALANHMAWMQRALPLDRDDAVLQKTPITFDASVWEFWAPLAAGARLVMARPGGHRDCAYLAEVAIRERVTVLQVVPSLLQALIDEPRFAQCTSLRRVFCGGEALAIELVRRFATISGAELWNLYGPTETCIDATAARCSPADRAVWLGRPIDNVNLHVLDERLERVPIGAVGELYIGGAALARGYLAAPELTAERFVPDPFATVAGARLYRTGDRVSITSDGQLEFMGRLDSQIKLRGFRIELGEIERVLGQAPGVAHAAVALRRNPAREPRLCAYYVAGGAEPPEPRDPRRFLEARLPSYMVPGDWVRLDRLPLLPSGKLDRQALPAPDGAHALRATAFAPPRDEVETRLVEIWRAVLGVAPIGIHDDFFELGGHSLLAVHLVHQIEQRFGKRVAVSVLFQGSTVEQLAHVLARDEQPAGHAVLLQAGGPAPSLFCFPPVGGQLLGYRELARALGGRRLIYGLQEPDTAATADVREVAARYLGAIRAIQHRGRYLLAGWSSGGTLAFEAACQLEALGCEVTLALLDAWAPAAMRPWLPRPELLELAPALLAAPERHGEVLHLLRAARAIGAIGEIGEIDPAALAAIIGPYRANVEALRAYRPGRFAGKVVELQARERMPGPGFDAPIGRSRGWDELCLVAPEIIALPGDHDSMLRAPFVTELAAVLDAHL